MCQLLVAILREALRQGTTTSTVIPMVEGTTLLSRMILMMTVVLMMITAAEGIRKARPWEGVHRILKKAQAPKAEGPGKPQGSRETGQIVWLSPLFLVKVKLKTATAWLTRYQPEQSDLYYVLQTCHLWDPKSEARHPRKRPT